MPDQRRKAVQCRYNTANFIDNVLEDVALGIATVALQFIPGAGEAADAADGAAAAAAGDAGDAAAAAENGGSIASAFETDEDEEIFEVGDLFDGLDEEEEEEIEEAEEDGGAQEGGSNIFSRAARAAGRGAKSIGGKVLNAGRRMVGTAQAVAGLEFTERMLALAEVHRIESGTSIYAIKSGSTSSPLAIVEGSNWRDLFQARLEVVNQNTDFVFVTGRTSRDASGLLDLYKNHPSAMRACLHEYRGDPVRCVGVADDLQNPTQKIWDDETASQAIRARLLGLSRELPSAAFMTDQMIKTGDATNCDKTNYGFGKKDSAETNPKLPENMSWWAGRTSGDDDGGASDWLPHCSQPGLGTFQAHRRVCTGQHV